MKSSNKYTEFLKNLKEGKICIFETDTVVGIGCTLMQNNSVNININKIFDIKNREPKKKLPWLISSEKMCSEYCEKLSEEEIKIIKKEWPGNTTIILKLNKLILPLYKDLTQENNGTIAFRIPDNKELINAINEIASPIVCTSANISGENPVSKIKDVDDKFLSKVDFVYEKNLSINADNKASKIIKLENGDIEVLRD